MGIHQKFIEQRREISRLQGRLVALTELNNFILGLLNDAQAQQVELYTENKTRLMHRELDDLAAELERRRTLRKKGPDGG